MILTMLKNGRLEIKYFSTLLRILNKHIVRANYCNRNIKEQKKFSKISNLLRDVHHITI